jgi:hypothetical protein
VSSVDTRKLEEEMDMVLKVLIALICVLFTGFGLGCMFAPEMLTETLAVTPNGAVGFNTIRGFIGGTFLALTSMLVLGLVKGDARWFQPVIIVVGVIALGRTFGYFVDGMDPAIIPLVGFEIGILAVLITADRRAKA